VNGWTIFFLVVDALWVIACGALAVRAGRADGGVRRRMWLAEASAYAALFGFVWLVNPAMTLGALSFYIPDAGFAGFALWWAVGLWGGPPREANWRAGAIAVAVLLWGVIVVGAALGHQARRPGGPQVDAAHSHVPVRVLDRRPTLADAAIDGASAERIERSVLGSGKLTMVVHAAADCEPAVVLLDDEGTTLDVLVVFQRSLFLSPTPSPSPSAPAGGICRPPVPGDIIDSGFRSTEATVQIDLPAGLSATAVRDASAA